MLLPSRRGFGHGSMLCEMAVCGIALASLVCVSSVSAQEQPVTQMSFVDTPLEFFIRSVAELTGQRFIAHPGVRVPSFTLHMEVPQTPSQVMETLTAELRKHGFRTERAGNDIRVVPVAGEDGTRAVPDIVMSKGPHAVIEPSPPGRNQLVARRLPPPADLTRQISLQAVRVNGLQRGYRVYPRGDGAELARLGLDPGDLVLSINGRTLEDPMRGTQIFNDSINAEVVTVRLERAGRTEHLQLA